MLSSVLLEVPQACVGLELVRLMDALPVMVFIPAPPSRVCALPTNRAICIYTQGFRQTLLHLPSQHCLTLPWVIHWVPWAPWE